MGAGGKASLATRASKIGNLSSQSNNPNLSPLVNSPVEQIFLLQRTVGNRGVKQLLESGVIQAKLASGPSIAKSGIQPSVTALRLRPGLSGMSERECACGGTVGISGECDQCGRKKRSHLQTKLNVSTPGDIYEQEAERFAHSVLSKPEKPPASEASPRTERFADNAFVGTMQLLLASALRSQVPPAR